MSNNGKTIQFKVTLYKIYSGVSVCVCQNSSVNAYDMLCTQKDVFASKNPETPSWSPKTPDVSSGVSGLNPEVSGPGRSKHKRKTTITSI